MLKAEVLLSGCKNLNSFCFIKPGYYLKAFLAVMLKIDQIRSPSDIPAEYLTLLHLISALPPPNLVLQDLNRAFLHKYCALLHTKCTMRHFNCVLLHFNLAFPIRNSAFLHFILAFLRITFAFLQLNLSLQKLTSQNAFLRIALHRFDFL